MCAERNKTYVTMSLATRFMVGLNDAKACVFTSSTRIRLKGGSVEASDLAEIILQFLSTRG